jgi:hypothetical protein
MIGPVEQAALPLGYIALTMRRLDYVVLAFVGSLIAAIIGVICFGIIQHSTYAVGPYLYDTALFNYIVGPQSHNLAMPSVINMPSFYRVHISPLLIPFSYISRMLGLTGFQSLELVLIPGFSGAAVAAFLVVRHYLRPLGRILPTILAAAFALAFGLSGVMRSTVDYPHIEILYVPLATAALFLMFQRRMRAAWIVFALGLMTREDAGLHMACVIAAYLFLAAISERGLPARTGDLLPFLIAAMIYPVFVLTAQAALLPIESNFARVYSGTPAYAHLTASFMARRWDALVSKEPEVLFLLASCLACFVARPRLLALTGIVAALPWFLVSITAVGEASGTMSLYYAFPFLVLCLVPFIVTAEMPSAKIENADHV